MKTFKEFADTSKDKKGKDIQIVDKKMLSNLLIVNRKPFCVVGFKLGDAPPMYAVSDKLFTRAEAEKARAVDTN